MAETCKKTPYSTKPSPYTEKENKYTNKQNPYGDKFYCPKGFLQQSNGGYLKLGSGGRIIITA